MDASNRARKPPRQTARRQADCSPRAISRRAAPGPSVSRAGPPAESPRSGGLKVTIRVIPLKDPESNPLRARQLAVIVDLLRRAAAEAAGRDAASPDRAESGK